MADVTTIKHLVTSIVSSTSPLTVSKELVPHKYHQATESELDTPGKIASALHTVQRNADDATKSARSLPHLGGVYIPDQVFAAYQPTIISHRVQSQVAWQAASVRPIAGYLLVTNVDSDAGVIRITTKKAHGLTSGDPVLIQSVGGVPANGDWNVIVVDQFRFDLALSTFSGSYTSGGMVLQRAFAIYEGDQDVQNGRITLISTLALVADLHFFPKPQAVRS